MASPVADLLESTQLDLPSLEATKDRQPAWPLHGLDNVAHTWEIEAGVKYVPAARASHLVAEKVVLSVSLRDVLDKYELSEAEEDLLRRVAGPRVKDDRLVLTKRFRYGDPDWHPASLHLADALGEDLRSLVAACVGDVRPAIRLCTSLVKDLRAEALIAFLIGRPTADLRTAAPSVEAMRAELVAFNDVVDSRRAELQDASLANAHEWSGTALWLVGGTRDALDVASKGFKDFAHLDASASAVVPLKHAAAIEECVRAVDGQMQLGWLAPIVRAALCREEPAAAVKFPWSAPLLARRQAALEQRKLALLAKLETLAKPPARKKPAAKAKPAPAAAAPPPPAAKGKGKK